MSHAAPADSDRTAGSPGPLDPAADAALVEVASERVLRSVERLDRAGRAAPSRCPGWSRAHVVSHLTHNADALVNHLYWAQTGERTPMYPSRERRDADIAAGAQLSPEQALLDLRAGVDRFRAAVAAYPNDRWDVAVRSGAGGGGPLLPAAAVPWMRLKELEVHHVDLDLDYTPAHWSEEVTSRLLADAVDTLGPRIETPLVVRTSASGSGHDVVVRSGPAGVRPTLVSGPASAVVAWLIGRSSGDGLSVEGPDGAAVERLPDLPPWR